MQNPAKSPQVPSSDALATPFPPMTLDMTRSSVITSFPADAALAGGRSREKLQSIPWPPHNRRARA